MTAQVPDELMIAGERWDLLATPLGPYLGRIGVRFDAPHTGLRRGYTARWRLDDDMLHLVDVKATARAPSGELIEVNGSEALGGAMLPMPASWVTGRVHAGSGGVVRYVHSDFDSRYQRELLLELVDGRVVSRQELAPPAAMGSAGPYQLHEPLLGDLSGGAFGQLVRATDLDGRPLVAKIARPRGHAHGTEMWSDTPSGRFPLHLPAQAFWKDTGGGLVVDELDGSLLADVLVREAELLERDGGVLLPRSYGLWDHDPSGAAVLVMEELEGRAPSTPAEVVAVLAALQAAVERGVFDSHGDVKREHIFIDGATVRLCDPAPRFADASRRAFTYLYNPHGFSGPAADVAACATILRYLPGASAAGWRWCAAVLDSPVPPPWAASHRSALRELQADLAQPAPPPPGWQVPPLPERRWHPAAPAPSSGLGAGPGGLAGEPPQLPAGTPTFDVVDPLPQHDLPQLPASAPSVEPLGDTVARVATELERILLVLEWTSTSSPGAIDGDPQLVGELHRLAAAGRRLIAAVPPDRGLPEAG